MRYEIDLELLQVFKKTLTIDALSEEEAIDIATSTNHLDFTPSFSKVVVMSIDELDGDE